MRFWLTTIGVAVTMVVGLAVRLGFHPPANLSDDEWMRRLLVGAAIIAGVSVFCGVFASVMGRLTDWANRKTDPWRRLG